MHFRNPSVISKKAEAKRNRIRDSLTRLPGFFGEVGTGEELSREKLNCHHSEDKLKQHEDDQDVEHVFQRAHDAVKHSLPEKTSKNIFN